MLARDFSHTMATLDTSDDAATKLLKAGAATCGIFLVIAATSDFGGTEIVDVLRDSEFRVAPWFWAGLLVLVGWITCGTVVVTRDTEYWESIKEYAVIHAISMFVFSGATLAIFYDEPMILTWVLSMMASWISSWAIFRIHTKCAAPPSMLTFFAYTVPTAMLDAWFSVISTLVAVAVFGHPVAAAWVWLFAYPFLVTYWIWAPGGACGWTLSVLAVYMGHHPRGSTEAGLVVGFTTHAILCAWQAWTIFANGRYNENVFVVWGPRSTRYADLLEEFSKNF